MALTRRKPRPLQLEFGEQRVHVTPVQLRVAAYERDEVAEPQRCTQNGRCT